MGSQGLAYLARTAFSKRSPAPYEPPAFHQLSRVEQGVVGSEATWAGMSAEQKAEYLLISRRMQEKNVSLDGLTLRNPGQTISRNRMLLTGDSAALDRYKDRLEDAVSAGTYHHQVLEQRLNPFHPEMDYIAREAVGHDSIHTGMSQQKGEVFAHFDQENPWRGPVLFMKHCVEVWEDATRYVLPKPIGVPTPYKLAQKLDIELGPAPAAEP